MRDLSLDYSVTHGGAILGPLSQMLAFYWNRPTVSDISMSGFPVLSLTGANVKDMRVRAEWGMNAVRYILQWSAIEPEKGQYDDAYLDQVAERMDWAQAAGLVVVLDMHQDLYGEGFQPGGNGAPRWTCDEARYAAFQYVEPWFLSYTDENMVACYDGLWGSEDLLSHYALAWRRVAARLADKPAVIGIDPMNEPYWGSTPVAAFERDTLSSLYRRVVAAVRAEAPGWLAFLEPSSSRNLGLPTHLEPFDFPDVVYAPHSYDQTAEGGGGFDAARRQKIVDNIALLADEAKSLDAAIWIGEYGGMSNKPGIADYMDASYDAAGAVGASSMYWHYGKDESYGLLNPDGTEKTELLDVLVRPYPERLAGDLIDFAYDEATRTLTVRYQPDTSVGAPGIIIAPARVYPTGVEVDCAGCTHEQAGVVVRIVSPPTDRPATLTIRPR